MVVLVFACSPVYAQLNFTNPGGFGGPNDVVTFSNLAFGPIALQLLPSGGTGPYLFRYADGATPIPGFNVINYPDLPAFFSAAARGGLIGLGLESDAGVTQSTMIQMTDLSNNQQVTKQVDIRVGGLDFGIAQGIPMTGAGVGDTVRIPIWAVGGTGPYGFSITTAGFPPGPFTGLPTGIELQTIDADEGLAELAGVVGMGAAGGPYQFGIEVTDAAQRTFRRFFNNIFISELHLNPFPGLPERVLPNGRLNEPYHQTLTATGCTGPCKFELVQGQGAPQTGIVLEQDGDVIGTPTQVFYNRIFTVLISDDAGHFQRVTLNLSTLPAAGTQALLIIDPQQGDYPAGQNRSLWITAIGGVPPYTLDLDPVSMALPDGVYPEILPPVVLGPEGAPHVGVVESRALPLGEHPFRVRVTDSLGNTASIDLELNITPIGVYYFFLPVGSNIPFKGFPYRQATFPIGGKPPYVFTPTNIRPNLTINNEAVVSGTPVVAGAFGGDLDYTMADSSVPPNTYFNDANIRVNDYTPMADETLPTGGGTVSDDSGTGAAITLPAGALPVNTQVAIDILPTAPLLTVPIGFSVGSLFINFAFSPTPPMPFPPGVSVVLPVAPPRPPGTPIDLYRLDPNSGLLVQAFKTNGAPNVGVVQASGNTALFTDVAQLSTIVGLVPRTGDVNRDGQVSCADLTIIRASFGKREGQAGFDIRADLRRDGIINVTDLALASRQLPPGTTCQ
jgi:hypothetical protein